MPAMPPIPQNVYALILLGLGILAFAIHMPDLYVGGLMSAGMVVFNSAAKAPQP